MFSLGINFAVPPFSLALVGANGLLIEKQFLSSAADNDACIDRIAEVCDEVGIALNDLSTVGCIVGPGTYTSLRTSIVTTNMLAQSLQIPAFGVSSLHAMANLYAYHDGLYLVLLPARKNEWHVMLYGKEERQLNELAIPFVGSEELVMGQLGSFEKSVSVLGVFTEQWLTEAKVRCPAHCFINAPLRAQVVADYALSSLKNGLETTPLKPYYAYEPV